MAKLNPRYNKYELATLLVCIKPVERWTRSELRAYSRDGDRGGFRHFFAPNITPIERYRPKPLPVQTAPASAQCVVGPDPFDLESLRLDHPAF